MPRIGNSFIEMNIILDTKSAEEEAMTAETRTFYLAIAKQTTLELQREFSKNYYLANCMAKINACE